MLAVYVKLVVKVMQQCTLKLYGIYAFFFLHLFLFNWDGMFVYITSGFSFSSHLFFSNLKCIGCTLLTIGDIRLYIYNVLAAHSHFMTCC